MVEQPSKPGYLPALDGLRGVAIALVVVFHVFVGRVSSGVDVFLFLGGVLFVNTQLSNATREGGLTAGQSALRLVRRLFPALLLVVATATVVLILTEPPVGWRTPLEQAAAGVLHVENWYLYEKTSGYATATAAAPPFQHLWSMSVQLQIYLVIIAVVYAVCWAARKLGFRARRALAVVLALATAASFAAATGLLIAGYGDLNYYATYTRFWEIGLGGLFGLWALKRRPALNTGAQVAAGVGLATICLVGLVIDGQAQFPGPAALIPLGAAALIVLASMGRARGGIVGLLESGPARTLGAWSYSLYLWHWPILIVATVVAGQETPSVGLGVTVVAVSLVLADLTHRFVERPLRQHARRPAAGERRARAALSQLRSSWPPRLRLIAGVVVAVLIAGLALLPAGWARYVAKQEAIGLDENLYPGAAAIEGAPVPEAEPQPPVSQLSMFVSDERLLGCFQDHNAGPLPVPIEERQKEDPNACVFGDPEGDTTVVALGGSHTQQWLPALNELGAANGVRIIPLTRSQCPPVLPVESESFQDNCYTFNEIALDRIASWEPDLVLTTGTRPFNRGGHPRELVPLSYIAMWNALKDIGVPVALLRDNPWMYDANEETWNPSVCEAEGGSEEFCGIPAEYFYQDEDPAEEYVWNVPGFETIDTREWFCPDGFCPPVIGNLRVYFDSNHVEHRYAETLAPLLWGQLEPIIEAAAEPGLRAAMLLSAPIPEPDDALIDDPGARRPGSPLPRDLAGGAPPAPGEELPGNATIYPFDPSPVEVKPFEPEM